MPEIIIWAVAFIVLTIFEVQTLQFVSIWFALSALVTMFLAIAGVALWIQIVVFILLSTLLLLISRPFVKKFIHVKSIPTNVELDIGKPASVIEEINNNIMKGRVRINGVDWSARSVDDTVIPVGTTVIIKEINSTKLYVEIKK